jgi:8-oxo-dGTP pyrophosphatase MutT (NUDIX family)
MSVDESNPWQLVRRETAFDCHKFEVWRDTIEHAGVELKPYISVRMKSYGVVVAPIDAQGRVVLVGQYRHVLEQYAWEVPGGGALKSADPLEVAKAELQEEAGARARQWLKIVDAAVSPGTSDERMPGYVAWDLEEGEPQPDPQEVLSLRRVPFSEAVAMSLRGEIANLVGVALLLGIHARLVRGELPGTLQDLLRARWSPNCPKEISVGGVSPGSRT